MTKIQSKKIQIPQNSEKLFLAKCFIEQQLEQIQKSSTQISLKGNTDDGSVLFRVVKTKEIAAVAINGNLYIFAKPVTSFKGLPLDCTMTPLNRIEKIDGVMRCVKCKKWVTDADVSQCPCGGYLKARKRFQVVGQITESLDAEYLEIQAALEDITISAQMDRRPRTKIPVSTGIITSSMAGMSSVGTQSTAAAYAGFLTVVAVKCTDKQPDFDDEDHTKHTHLPDNKKYSFFKEIGVDVELVQNNEIKEFAVLGAKRIAEIAVKSWDHDTIPRSAVEDTHHARQRQTSRNITNSSIPSDTEGRKQNFKRQQHKNHKTTQNAKPNKKKMATCFTCGNKTSALVESKCTECFLEVTN